MLVIKKFFLSLCRRPRENIPFLDGLRALSILWVVVYHLLLYPAVYTDAQTYQRIVQHVPLAVLRGFFGVDIFFVMSGFLISLQFYTEFDAKCGINLKKYYIRRALRILPVYYFVLTAVCLFPNSNCRHVWANFLYVNNFIPYGSMCLPWTWSLAVEEQFYLTFPIFCMFLFRSRHRLTALVGVLALTIAENVIYFFKYQSEFHPPIGLKPDDPVCLSFIDRFYDKTDLRISPILIGIILAYLYRYHFDVIVKMLSRTWLRWALFLSTLSGCYSFLSLTWEEGSMSHPLFLLSAATSHTLFGLFVAVLMLLAFSGVGLFRYLNWFLSLRLFYPIAQVSYSLYLIHVIVFTAIYKYEAPTPENMLVLAMLGILIASALSVLLYVFVEQPFIALRRAIENRR